ncbi:hypothetical protein [Sphaerisporangium rhizosphaerae]|uniref:Uncharacterized protein n=1 Tax=Sphaerisporangium rhizosphaerae TaxID=2269375 RepID=A0ABW2NYG5_9ACTN
MRLTVTPEITENRTIAAPTRQDLLPEVGAFEFTGPEAGDLRHSTWRKRAVPACRTVAMSADMPDVQCRKPPCVTVVDVRSDMCRCGLARANAGDGVNPDDERPSFCGLLQVYVLFVVF